MTTRKSEKLGVLYKKINYFLFEIFKILPSPMNNWGFIKFNKITKISSHDYLKPLIFKNLLAHLLLVRKLQKTS